MIVEPVAGSTGVLIPPKGYLQRLREICTKHGILLIFDEVITGFGRTGAAFAADKYGVQPDMITCAKGLTNGVIPMGAVLATAAIHDAFMTGPEHMIELFHGYTYSGNPIAAAAGLATLETYARGGAVRARGGAGAATGSRRCTRCRDCPHVIDIRNEGLIGAVELEPIAGQPTRAGLQGLPRRLRRGDPDPHDRRHHRDVAAADHLGGPDRRADRYACRADVLQRLQ